MGFLFNCYQHITFRRINYPQNIRKYSLCISFKVKLIESLYLVIVHLYLSQYFFDTSIVISVDGQLKDTSWKFILLKNKRT